MGSFHADDIILSYNDAVLRRSDLDILRGPHYINDCIIEFYFSYLSSSYSSNDILLVPPSISFWLMHCVDVESIKDVARPLNLSTKNIVIFTVNDNEDFGVKGGAHWSLVVYDREMNTFVHHDSMGGLNKYHAQKLVKAIKKFVFSDARFMEGYTPQQYNGYDCGLYVMAIAKTICQWHEDGSNNEERWFSAAKEEITLPSVGKLRMQTAMLIESLIQETNATKSDK